MTETGRDKIARDFLDAIDRLKAGTPNHPALKERAASGKKPEVSISNVALEAGRARGLIARKGTNYADIRSLIINERSDKASVTVDRVSLLKNQVADLRSQLNAALDHAAHHYELRMRAENKAARYKDRYDRLIASLKNSNSKLGTVISLD